MENIGKKIFGPWGGEERTCPVRKGPHSSKETVLISGNALEKRGERRQEHLRLRRPAFFLLEERDDPVFGFSEGEKKEKVPLPTKKKGTPRSP